MKGLVLAGGFGTRMLPCTKVVNKHLLPVYNKPMIYYPLETLLKAGVRDIMIVTGPEHAGAFLELLGSGKDFGCRFTYKLQDEAGGIAQAIGLVEDFADETGLTVILGDNIFEDNLNVSTSEQCKIFLKEVKDAKRFGVAEVSNRNEVSNRKIASIEEKPEKPKSCFAITGLYIFNDLGVFDIIRRLKPSARGELEITDILKFYMKNDSLDFEILNGFWSDAGTFPSLMRTTQFLWSRDQ